MGTTLWTFAQHAADHWHHSSSTTRQAVSNATAVGESAPPPLAHVTPTLDPALERVRHACDLLAKSCAPSAPARRRLLFSTLRSWWAWADAAEHHEPIIIPSNASRPASALVPPRNVSASRSSASASAMGSGAGPPVPTLPNLVCVKTPKCASSTFCGLLRRVAATRGLSGARGSSWIAAEPGVWANHAPLGLLYPKMRHLRLPSFLLTFVREPASRCLSEFYHFRVSRESVPPTAEHKIGALKACANRMHEYVRTGSNARADTPEALVRNVYSFVGVVERFEESAVLLASALGVPLSSVLYLPSKNSSEARRDPLGHLMVAHPAMASEPESVRAHATGDDFNQRNALDVRLWTSANALLEERWAAERHTLEKHLVAFRGMLRTAHNECGEHPSSTSHATANGLMADHNRAGSSSSTSLNRVTTCYWRDHGCGYPCLDKLHHSGDSA